MEPVDDKFATAEVQELVRAKLFELRKRLLDFSRRNPLISIRLRPTSTSVLRVIDELPDVLRYNLTNGKPMRLVPLPALEEELPDEQTEAFLDELNRARGEDEGYREEVDKVDASSEKAEEDLLKIERALKDRIRKGLKLPKRQTKEEFSPAEHAENHGIAPNYILPLPEDEHEDGRHNDTDVQTLLLPERLSRVARGILEKGHSFERETGVNVLHAGFGLLEWKDPAERDKFVSPLLLLEIGVKRSKSRQGARFDVSGVDKVFINTTLALKLNSEHGLSMPDYEGGTVEDYFTEIADMAPEGWYWKVRREVVFGIFPSSKIAMYHDLDPDKRPISQNEIVCRVLASSGGGDGSYAEVYETDDPKVAKKVPYLVRDADATQYSALVDVANGRNLSIEGPPGSGKSQTIVNLIAAALAENKKVLFVAEKLTALDIVKNRLEASKLGAFILPLQAGRGTRENIYESLKERLTLDRATGRSRDDFIGHQSALERQRVGLQGYLDALGSKFGTTGMTVYHVIGHGIASAKIREAIPKNVRRIRLDDAEHLDREAVDALVGDAKVFAERLSRSHRMPKLWRASNVAVASREEAEDVGEAAEQLALEMDGFVKESLALGLAPFVASAPFSIDLDALEALLKTVTAEAGRIDPALVESLANAERRRQVLTLCEQIHEHQKVHARLARSLHDPADRNISKRLDAALCFASENGDGLLPKSHRGRIAAIEQDISSLDTLIVKVRKLPSGWAAREGTTLRSIRDDAARLMDFSDNIRALRRSDVSRQAASLATEVFDTVRSLSNTLDEICEALPKAGNHDPAQIRSTAETIRNSGVFRLLSPKFRNARNIYQNLLGGSPHDECTIMAQRLDVYASWLRKRRTFRGDTRFSAVFGEIFKGFETDTELITQANGFYACCQDIAKDDVGLQQYLETGYLATVGEIARIETAPDLSLAELEALPATRAKHLAEEKALLEEAEGHLALFKDRVGIERAELEEVIAAKNQKEELTARIEASSPAASLLGERFVGVETRTDVLQVECNLAERLTEAPDPALAISILRSGTAQDLLEELRTFRARRDNIDKSASALWTRLDLSEEIRSTTALHDCIDDLKHAASDIDSLLDYARLKRLEGRLRCAGFRRACGLGDRRGRGLRARAPRSHCAGHHR